MRILANQDGVQAPSVDYTKGRIVDGQTVVGEGINGDIVEFFHKLAALAGITENDLPDNETNGHQLIEAFWTYSGKTKKAIIPIGTWNMDSTAGLIVAWALPANHRLLKAEVMINLDSGYSAYPLNLVDIVGSDGIPAGSWYYSNGTQFVLERVSGRTFDQAAFSGAGNRGYITVEYIDETLL